MKIKNNNFDILPKKNYRGNFLYEDLKIIDFKMIRIYEKLNTYFIPVYVLTDLIPLIDGFYYETMVRVGYSDNCDFLDIQERCYSKLEAYKQHKMIYKKITKGFYHDDIIKIINNKNRGNL